MGKNIPFHCGSQYMDWQERNCCRCSKCTWDAEDLGCDIAMAISACAITGDLSDEMAKRMGLPGNECAYTWACPEFAPQKAE